MNTNISVALAAYNGEKYIEKQIYSILSQSLEVNEIVIVDDNSSDNTFDILKSLSFEYPKIKLIKNPTNLGPKASFKLAIKNSTNDYIILSDQDDIWDFCKVELNFNEMNLIDSATQWRILCASS